MNKDELRKKVFLDLLSAPLTLLPTAAGLSCLIVGWALGIGTEALSFAGIAGVLVGIGSLATRWIFGADQITKKAFDELQAESLKKRHESLDELDRRLREDEDPRTEQSLRELRRLYETFRKSLWTEVVGERAALDIATKVELLFRGCVRSLERSLELWKRAGIMETKRARAELLASRDAVLDEVSKSIEQLAKTLDEIEAMAVERESTTDDLARVRAELDESLDVARRVEARMSDLETEIDGVSARRLTE